MVGRSLDDLGTGFSWADFAAFIRFTPPTSQLGQAVNGPAWAVTDLLLASTIDTLRLANWQRAGGKGSKPKPIRVPGSVGGEKSWGSANEFESVRSYLEARNGRVPEVR